jgi:hypothetical protein
MVRKLRINEDNGREKFIMTRDELFDHYDDRVQDFFFFIVKRMKEENYSSTRRQAFIRDTLKKKPDHIVDFMDIVDKYVDFV